MNKPKTLNEMLAKDIGKSMLQRINERYAGCPTWEVTVFAGVNVPETHTFLCDSREHAKTSSMLLYTQPLNGAAVQYKVIRL